jgi:hypothetical protein
MDNPIQKWLLTWWNGFLESACVDVLAPYIAQLFNLLYDKACIPACWKQAKLSRLYKKDHLWTPTITACWLSWWHYVPYVCHCCSLFAYWVVCGNWSDPWHKMVFIQAVPRLYPGRTQAVPRPYPGCNTLQHMFILRFTTCCTNN